MFTDFDWLLINKNNTNIQILPALMRNLDEDFDPEKIALNWKI
jgi:hypothetical protein